MANGRDEYLKILLKLTVFLSVLQHLADGLRVEGDINTREDWVFLSRFCFLSEKGALSFEFSYPQEYETQNILLYFDEPGQWAAVYKNEAKNCYQKEAVLRPENNQIINLTTRYTWSGCVTEKRSDVDYLVCKGGRSFRSARERWWFVALDNCATTKGLKIHYKLHMTNSQDDDFKKEFSADEFYILEQNIGFLLVSVLLLMMSCYVAFELRSRQLFHTTYKMYMVAMACECIYLFVKVIAYGIQKDTGYKYEGLITFGRIFQGINVIVFLLMLILMAKGYTITRGRISQCGTAKIAVFTCLYSLAYVVVFINELVLRDPGAQLYLYENAGGYVLIAMRLLGWIWFCYAIFFTLKNYPEKSRFYYPFFIIYTFWFWIGPIMIFIAMEGIPLWMREKIVNGVEHLIELLGHVIFLILTRPAAANSNFPYHVRTTQIGVMAPVTVPEGASPEDQSFSSYAYAPSQHTTGPPSYNDTMGTTETSFSDMFCVEKDKEKKMSNGVQNNNFSVDSYPHDTRFLANGDGRYRQNGEVVANGRPSTRNNRKTAEDR